MTYSSHIKIKKWLRFKYGFTFGFKTGSDFYTLTWDYPVFCTPTLIYLAYKLGNKDNIYT